MTRVVILYVHGLWVGGGESFLLRHRLARSLGAETCVFSYPSVGANLEDNAAALGRYLAVMSAETVHLVAHSLGGLLVLELFERQAGAARLPPGRIVLTGSPVRGSRAASRLARWPLGRAMLGRTAGEVLLEPRERRWHGERDLGVIAGDLGVGLGRLMGPMDAPNDGTVLVEETELPGAADALRLPVSHTGLVFSAEVARQVAVFFRTGRFSREERVAQGLDSRFSRF
jgi:pimeloyl-ACP methyl ester carboxylesterase